MTERWQQEVRKLSTVEPERNVWERAATRAPGGDGLPPPRQRVIAGVVAFGVFFAAASFGWLALRPTAERTPGEVTEGTEALVTLRVGTEGSGTAPIATLKVDGVIHVGRAMSYVWDGASNPMPWLEPPYRARDFVTIELPAVVSLAGDADWADARLHPPDSFLSGEGQELGRLETPQPIDVAPGRYVMEIRGHWRDHGNPSFYFPIQLVEPALDGALTTLAGTEWRLIAIDGVPIDEDEDQLAGASIEFKENMFGGWSGCNSFGGKYRTDGSSFSVDGIGGTEVGPCSGEEAWFARLESAESWTSDGSTLTVSGPAGSFTAVRVGMEPVDVLHVDCLPGSTQVLDRQVVATANGVAGIFGPAGHAKRVGFVPVAASAGDETNVSLGDEVTATTVPLTPGDWAVRCAGWSDEFRPVEITVLPEQQTSTSPGEAVPDVGDPTLPDVLRVRCTDAGAEVLTPEVAARAGGLHVEATPGSADHADAIELRPLAWPVVNFSSGSSGVDGVFVRAVPEGEVIVSCYREEDGGGRITPDPQDGEAIARVVDPGDFYTPWIPACALEDQVAFDDGERFDLAGLEGAEAVRALIPAVRPSDDVARGGYGAERFESSLFSVMRNGIVVGSVWIDSNTGGTRISSGFACAGSGIEEGFETYPAWEGDS